MVTVPAAAIDSEPVSPVKASFRPTGLTTKPSQKSKALPMTPLLPERFKKTAERLPTEHETA
jgi:hypothetical protein